MISDIKEWKISYKRIFLRRWYKDTRSLQGPIYGKREEVYGPFRWFNLGQGNIGT